MTTRVQQKGNDIWIMHNGCVYHDVLRTSAEMAVIEQRRIQTQVEAARKETRPLYRRWHFTLRNNAAKRRNTWLSK